MTMRNFKVSRIHLAVLFLAFLAALPLQSVSASPFGQGVFGADVPFGSNTSLTISLGSNVSLSLSPSGGNLAGTGSHTVTVTTTDVIGYKLYAFSPFGTAMTNGSDTIAASANSSPSSLATDTWGFNTSGSTTNFIGMPATPILLKDASGPYKNGDATTVTYGVLASKTKAAGNYSVGVVYTAVAENE